MPLRDTLETILSEPVVHLSLNQGTTAVREEFGGRTRQVLKDRAELMRKRVSDFGASLPVSQIDLGSDARLPGDYVAGHALGMTYTLENLPEEQTLRSDLQIRSLPSRSVSAHRATARSVSGF
jgi:5-methylcytosine-specific restriction protein A